MAFMYKHNNLLHSKRQENIKRLSLPNVTSTNKIHQKIMALYDSLAISTRIVMYVSVKVIDIGGRNQFAFKILLV